MRYITLNITHKEGKHSRTTLNQCQNHEQLTRDLLVCKTLKSALD